MKKPNSHNVRAIHSYCQFLREAKRLDESTIDGVTKAINRFEEFTSYRDFKLFKSKHAMSFKKDLLNRKSLSTGEALSKATVNTTLRHLKNFFQYLALQQGYKTKITYSDIEYFNLSEKDTKVATAKRKRPVATIEEILQVLGTMPSKTHVEMRDKALIAFTLLTGARDSAIASLKLKHIDMKEQSLYQDAREVKTKFSKTFTTYFFPVGELPLQIFSEWIDYLSKELGFAANDPLFPKTKIDHNKNKEFVATGLLKEHWNSAGAIRRIFKESFQLAELPYYNPHSFRNTLVRLGENICKTPEEFKAWSQNLGHESVLTSFYSYGDVPDYKQAELLRKLAQPPANITNDMEQQFKQFMQFQEMMKSSRG